MHAIKDRVYDKVSRLFSDSQSSHETLDQAPEVPFVIVFVGCMYRCMMS